MFRRSVPPSLPWKCLSPLAAATPPTIPFFSPVPNAQQCTGALHHPPWRGAAQHYHGPHDDDNPFGHKTMRWGENLPCCPSLLRCTTMLRPTRVLRCQPSSPPPPPSPPSADPLTLDDITALPPLPRCVPEPCEGVTKWTDVDKLQREADMRKYVDAWLVEYNKTRPADAKFEWSDTFRATYAHKFTGYAAEFEQEEIVLVQFQKKLAKLLTRSTPKTLVQRLGREAKSVLRDQFSVLTSNTDAIELQNRVPQVTPPAGIRLIEIDLRDDKASLLGGASGSGKTHAAIQSATDWIGEDGCVLYHVVSRSKEEKHAGALEYVDNAIEAQLAAPLDDAQQQHNAVLYLPMGLNKLLAMMEHLDQKLRILQDSQEVNVVKDKTEKIVRGLRADVFARYVEMAAKCCTTLFEDLKKTTETIRVAVVLDEVGDKPYLVRAACSLYDRSIESSATEIAPAATTLQKRLGLSGSVELAVVLCGTGVGAAGCLGGSRPDTYNLSMLTPTSARTLWATVCETYPELQVADCVSPTCHSMGSSNARMAMLLVECLTKMKYKEPLDKNYANVLTTAETVARLAAIRFKEMNGFRSVKLVEMLRLYGRALRACMWHTDPEKHLEHPDVLTKYGAITDLRTIVDGRLVAANGSEKEGRCFTIAPAMMAFFRIMLSYNSVVPIDVTGESFEHAMLHYVGAALRSCAGRSVRDFLSLIVTDATTIPNNSSENDDMLTIPSNIDETLLMLSLGHRKFDSYCLAKAFEVTEVSNMNPQRRDHETGDQTKEEEARATKEKEARATKEVLDLAFTMTPATTTAKRRARGTRNKARKKHNTCEYRLTANCPVVLLNGSKAAAADIIVIVPGVLVCHVQCKDYIDDANFFSRKKSPNEAFVNEYIKMTRNLYLAEPNYCVMATTSPEDRLEVAIGKRDMKMMVLRVPRISDKTPNNSFNSASAVLQSLVGLCKADIKTGMIVQCGEAYRSSKNTPRETSSDLQRKKTN